LSLLSSRTASRRTEGTTYRSVLEFIMRLTDKKIIIVSMAGHSPEQLALGYPP